MYNKGLEVTLNATPINKSSLHAKHYGGHHLMCQHKEYGDWRLPGLTQIITTSPLVLLSESVSITKPGYALGMIYVTRTGGVDPQTGRRIF